MGHSPWFVRCGAIETTAVIITFIFITKHALNAEEAVTMTSSGELASYSLSFFRSFFFGGGDYFVVIAVVVVVDVVVVFNHHRGNP